MIVNLITSYMCVCVFGIDQYYNKVAALYTNNSTTWMQSQIHEGHPLPALSSSIL